MSDAAEAKATLRAELLAALRAVTAGERAARSGEICARIVASDAWQESERVLLFSPMRSEPDIAPLHRAALESGKEAAAIPSSARIVEELELPFVPDLVLVPGLAFSNGGQRLGRGGGFYDRLLTGRAKHALKLGVCFQFQLRDVIPREQHDVRVDFVVSA